MIFHLSFFSSYQVIILFFYSLSKSIYFIITISINKTLHRILSHHEEIILTFFKNYKKTLVIIPINLVRNSEDEKAVVEFQKMIDDRREDPADPAV